MPPGGEHPRRHNSFSINAAPPKQPISNDPHTLLRSANLLIAASISLLFIGISPFFFPADAASESASASSGHPGPIYLRFPYSCVFFLPLLIPLSTYLVIARWTGEKHYRHS